MMTVLQLGPFPPPHGGVQTNLVAIRNHLRRHGIAAPVINLTRHRRPDADDVYYPESALAVMRLLVRLRADVIHLHFGGELTARLLALCFFCCLLPHRKVALTFHSGGYPSGAGKNLTARSLAAFVLRRLDAAIAVNDEIAAWFRRLGVSSSCIRTICPFAPVDVADASVLPPAIREFAASHTPLLTTVGLLEPEYDLPLQIRAMREVRRRHPRAGLVIVGSGSLEPQLRGMIASHPDAAHILLCGDVPHAATLRLMADSDVFLRTTLYDGDSVSVREGLQVGVPVVATDNGMRPDGVMLIPRADEAALVAAIDDALQITRGPRTAEPGEVRSLDQMLALYGSLVGRELVGSQSSAASVL